MLILIAFSGLSWIVPFYLFAPSVIRVWRGTADALDVMLSPVAFISANQMGYALRWLLFPHAVVTMSRAELTMWSGLYTLSTMSSLSLIVAWRVARGLR